MESNSNQGMLDSQTLDRRADHQSGRRTLRILRRTALPCSARGDFAGSGDKTGDERWYEVHVPRADKLYDQHLEEMKKQDKKEESQHG
jgi:hypothetical protein